MKPLLFLFLCAILSFSVGSQQSLLYFKNQHSRIIGGQEVDSDSTLYPYQVSFQSKSGDHICGGAILDKRNIILAAHCMDRVNVNNTRIVAGVINLKKTEKAQVVEIEKFVQHAQFNFDTSNNDIGLLHLKKPLVFNEHVEKVSLYGISSSKEATFTGWGSTSFPEIERISDNLNQLQGEVIHSSPCKIFYEELQLAFAITINQICFGGNGHGFCPGDSGGPLICGGKFLCGIASWGYECGLDKYPGVFTDVQGYTDWIEANKKKQ